MNEVEIVMLALGVGVVCALAVFSYAVAKMVEELIKELKEK